MTREQSKRIYIAAGGERDHSEEEWRDIHDEIERMVAARTDRGAAKVILWWGCWDRKCTAVGFARKIRKLAAEL